MRGSRNGIGKGTAAKRGWAVIRSTNRHSMSNKCEVQGGDREETKESESIADRMQVYTREK